MKIINSKLIRIIKLLTSEEMKTFRDFVSSPYINKDKKCLLLLDLIIPYAPDFSNTKLDSPQFYTAIYTKQRSFDKVKEKLLKLLEQFFQYQQFNKEEGLQKYFLLEELRKRREYKHYELVAKKKREILNKAKKDNKTFFNEYLLEVSYLEMLYQKRFSQDKKASQLEKTIRAFDKYLLSNHLWLDNTVLNAVELGTEKTKEITKEVILNSALFLKIAEQDYYKRDSLINMRILLNKLQKKGEEEVFNQAFKFLKENYKLISIEENKQFSRFLSNYCINKTIQGDDSYYQKLLNIFIHEIEYESANTDLELYPNRMRNIIITSVKANKIERAYLILEKYFNYIVPKYKDVTSSYCRGYLHFHEKRYSDATNNLLQCINMKSLFEIDAQSMLYKIYYETSEDWAFDIPVQSFTARLSRHKNRHPKIMIQAYINFFIILRQIYRKKEDPNYKKTKEDILLKMENMTYLSSKQWLKEKLNELKSKN